MLSNYRLKEMRERRDRDEAADLERKLAPVKAELSANQVRADKMLKADWSMNLKHLASLINEGTFNADAGATFPTTDEPQGGARGRAEFETFVNETLVSRGFVLSEAGSQRLLLYVLAQAFSENRANLADPETYEIAWSRLYGNDCFSIENCEVGFDKTKVVAEPVVEQPAPRLTLDSLENLDTSTRTGQKIAGDILSEAVFGRGGEAYLLFREWLDSLRNHFNYDMPRETQLLVLDWFVSNRRSWMDRRAFDDCRLNLCRRNIMPDTCLTPENRLTLSLENADDQSFEGRRKIKADLLASRNR